MTNWVLCSRYDDERSPLWVNLDHVVSIRPFSDGSTLVCWVRDKDAAMELIVWDSPRDILARKAGSDD